MRPGIITLTTDFGLRDPYVAEMKAVVLSLHPEAKIVDVSHDIAKFDIRMGAYTLACAARYFPKGTIHVAVVDPCVGTKRRSIIIQTKRAYYVGPDNGLLVPAASQQGIGHAYEITNRELMLPTTSNTFHGRDVFAPAAAHLANGTESNIFGPEIHEITMPRYAKTVRRKNTLRGEVLHIDDFGNIITGIREEELASAKTAKKVKIKLGNRKLELNRCRTYADAQARNPVALVGSHGFLEISINSGNAARMLRAKSGDKVTLYLR
jgi:S-adenosylmethionine hydrolase